MKGREPRSRTVVNPASRVALALLTAAKAERNGESLNLAISSNRSARLPRCVWQSISPGRTVAPERLMTSAPSGMTTSVAGADGLDPIALDRDDPIGLQLVARAVEKAAGADIQGLRRGVVGGLGVGVEGRDDQAGEEEGARQGRGSGGQCFAAVGGWPSGAGGLGAVEASLSPGFVGLTSKDLVYSGERGRQSGSMATL